ncbi:MAG: NUDIX hydrolase [Acidobacteria bacterium]|nr:NUDIX hydrolase [Acidobacteriota bacterium]
MTNTEFEETKIDGRRVFEGRILTLEVDRVRLPSGGQSEREVIRHPGAAVMVPVTEAGEVLFVRQFRYATGEILLELPAGKLDPGENPATCAERETAEETGFRPGTVEKLGEFYTAPGFTDELIRAFLVTDLVPAPEAEADADEVLEMVSLTVDSYAEMVARGEIRDAKTLAAMAMWLGRRVKGEG